MCKKKLLEETFKRQKAGAEVPRRKSSNRDYDKSCRQKKYLEGAPTERANNKVVPMKKSARLTHRRHSEGKGAEGPSEKWQKNGTYKKQSLSKIKWEQEFPKNNRGRTTCKLCTRQSNSIGPSTPQVIGDKQCVNCTQDFPTVLDQGISQTIGNEQHVNHTQDNSTVLNQGIPQAIGDELHMNCAQGIPMTLV